MIRDLVSDLAMHVIVRKVIATSRNDRVAAIPVVTRLADVQLGVMLALSDDNVDSESPPQTFGVKREYMCHSALERQGSEDWRVDSGSPVIRNPLLALTIW